MFLDESRFSEDWHALISLILEEEILQQFYKNHFFSQLDFIELAKGFLGKDDHQIDGMSLFNGFLNHVISVCKNYEEDLKENQEVKDPLFKIHFFMGSWFFPIPQSNFGGSGRMYRVRELLHYMNIIDFLPLYDFHLGKRDENGKYELEGSDGKQNKYFVLKIPPQFRRKDSCLNPIYRTQSWISHLTRNETESQWRRFLSDEKFNIFMLWSGFGRNSLGDMNFQKELERRLIEGHYVRFLLYDPSEMGFYHRFELESERQGYKPGDAFLNNLNQVFSHALYLLQNYPSNFEIRYTKAQ